MSEGTAVALAAGMRPRTLLSDVQTDRGPTRPRPSHPGNQDTYERVRRTLDEALAELQLPMLDREDSGVIRLQRQPSAR